MVRTRAKVNQKSSADLEKMRAAGKLAYEVLYYAGSLVKPGVTTNEINDACEKMTRDAGAVSAPLNYKGFPKSICASVDNVVCHGIPGDDPLLEGQMVNIDITVIKDGFHGDTSATFFVGEVDDRRQRLAYIAKAAMYKGIAQVKPGNTLGDVGHAIQRYVEKNGYSVVRDYIGHGIGRDFHEEPAVHHVGKRGKGLKLKPGMTFTIEPMVNEGEYKVNLLEDKWTVITADGKLSAQFEHTVAVTETGVDILTAGERTWEDLKSIR